MRWDGRSVWVCLPPGHNTGLPHCVGLSKRHALLNATMLTHGVQEHWHIQTLTGIRPPTTHHDGK